MLCVERSENFHTKLLLIGRETDSVAPRSSVSSVRCARPTRLASSALTGLITTIIADRCRRALSGPIKTVLPLIGRHTCVHHASATEIDCFLRTDCQLAIERNDVTTAFRRSISDRASMNVSTEWPKTVRLLNTPHSVTQSPSTRI